MQEDAKRSRRIAKSRELFEQQLCCEFSRDSILPDLSVLTCLRRGPGRTARPACKRAASFETAPLLYFLRYFLTSASYSSCVFATSLIFSKMIFSRAVSTFSEAGLPVDLVSANLVFDSTSAEPIFISRHCCFFHLIQPFSRPCTHQFIQLRVLREFISEWH